MAGAGAVWCPVWGLASLPVLVRRGESTCGCVSLSRVSRAVARTLVSLSAGRPCARGAESQIEVGRDLTTYLSADGTAAHLPVPLTNRHRSGYHTLGLFQQNNHAVVTWSRLSLF